jgi:hypothetical protein
VRLEEHTLSDGEGELQVLYRMMNAAPPERRSAVAGTLYDYYDTYRLRLPAGAMNTIEQIVICKLMLFSYIYHHPKVRAAEGILIDMLSYAMKEWRAAGLSDADLVKRFLRMTDDVLSYPEALVEGLPPPPAAHIRRVCHMILNRTLPREVYRIGGAVGFGPQRDFLRDFLTTLQDREMRAKAIDKMTRRAGELLVEQRPQNWTTPEEAIMATALRIDVPKAPQFEDVNELVVKGAGSYEEVQLLQVFPIEQWTQAYTHYRYYVRVFCLSEYVSIVRDAAKTALKEVLKIESDEFYAKILRQRN